MYQLAREGIQVERKPRRVRIYGIQLMASGPDWLDLDIRCSSGTYIRSLGAEIARALGTVGHLESLKRTECAGWDLGQARNLEEADPETLAACVIPVHQVLSRISRVDVDEDMAARLSMGQCLTHRELAALGLKTPGESTLLWFTPPSGAPLVLARLKPDGMEMKMEIVRVLFPVEKNA
jgi:tRNA pseudouridine55 synthase